MYTDRHSCTGLCSSSAGGSKGGALVVLGVQQRLWRVRSQAARRGQPGAPACMSVLCVCTHTRTHYTWMKGDQQVLTARLMRMDDEDSSVKLYLLQAIDSYSPSVAPCPSSSLPPCLPLYLLHAEHDRERQKQVTDTFITVDLDRMYTPEPKTLNPEP